MRNVAELLRPGGWFVFTEAFAPSRTQPGRHYVRRSRSEVEGALEAAGLQIESERPAFVLMTYPYGARNPANHDRWKRLVAARTHSEIVGNVVGSILFLPELVLTRLLKTGPSASIVVARKPIVTHQPALFNSVETALARTMRQSNSSTRPVLLSRVTG